MLKRVGFPALFFLLMLGLLFSCRKEKVLTAGGVVSFSTDTLKFDTVFTAAGSFTSGCLIYNSQNETINLSSVRVRKGDKSFFHLNVDGFPGNNVENIKIAPHDSIYVFVTVKIDPTNELNPFLISDELVATLNGKEYAIPFTAYGQNAHYIVSDSLTGNNVWLTDKPYVVLHSCVIGPDASLTIPANCRVYMHQDARFFVYGALSINPDAGPTSKDSVVLQGDRLDRDYFGYRGYPGEWGGIYVISGGQCTIKNTIIKNCGGSSPYYNYGIQPAAVEVDTGGTLVMTNTVIKNSIGHGIFCFQGKVTATNCLIANCGGQALAVVLGGIDSLTNCTFANNGTYALQHIDNPTVGIVNWLQVSQTQYIYSAVDVVMRNCIVWGSLDSELVYDTTGSAQAGVYSARILFDHCLLKKGTVENQLFARFKDCFNADPMFISEEKWDFHIPGTSPAAGVGTVAYTPNYDIEGNLRIFGRFGYDLGCYQSKP